MNCLNVLISAYACRPGMGSEPGVGWFTVCELANHHNIWVLTREDNRPFIEAELAKNPIQRLQFIYCDLPLSAWWKQNLLGVHLHYYLWQVRAYFLALKFHQEVQFDLAHHVTYVRYSAPSFLCLLPIPFIWGPVGGGESVPAPFWVDFSFRAKLYEAARIILRQLGEWDPFTRMTARRSAVVRVTTEDTAARIRGWGVKAEVFPEASLPEADIARLAQCSLPEGGPVRFISMGRLLHWKGFHLGLRAFAQADLADAEYWIVGDGPEFKRLQQLAEQLKVAPQVKFWGRLSRDETLAKLEQCHVLVHPSLHDSGGWVCLEAMAAGRAVLCLDLGGPAVQVTAETGIKASAHTPEQSVQELSVAMIQLVKSSDLRISLGEAGRIRAVKDFSWENRGSFLALDYKEIVGNRI